MLKNDIKAKIYKIIIPKYEILANNLSNTKKIKII